MATPPFLPPAPPPYPPYPPPPAASPDRASARAWLLATFGPAVIWVVAFAVAALAASPDLGPGCGDTFESGCPFTPRDGVLFVCLIGGVVVVPVLTGLTLVAAGLAKRHAEEVLVAILGGLAFLASLLVGANIA